MYTREAAIVSERLLNERMETMPMHNCIDVSNPLMRAPAHTPDFHYTGRWLVPLH